MLPLFQRRSRAVYVLGWLRMSKKRLTLGMVCSGKPAKLVRKTIGLLINGNTTEYLTLSKNVKADVIKIFLKIVLILLINFGQPSRNSMLPNYPLNKVWGLRWKDQIKPTKASLPTAFANISEPLPEIWKANNLASWLYLEQTWKKSC